MDHGTRRFPDRLDVQAGANGTPRAGAGVNATEGLYLVRHLPRYSRYSGQAPRSDHSSSIAWYFPVLSSSVPQILCEAWCAPRLKPSDTPRPRSRLRVFSRISTSLSVSICGPQRLSASISTLAEMKPSSEM